MAEILGDFELYPEQIIGKGGFGAVYKGKQVSLNRPVAIKFLNKDLTSDESAIQRFRLEAECLAKLADEHIIQVFGAGEHEGAFYFAMEYVPGLALDKFLQRNYKFTEADVVYIALAVTKALKSAWECPEQIIHRDIKPSNIMLAFPPQVLASGKLVMKEARIKVMDFGLARLAQRTEDAGLTTEGMIVGTPRYISPEQALGRPVDIRSDIYSLGIVLYELTTGKLPFESDSAMGYVQQHISAIAPLPRLINPQISPELESVVLKCIHKSPEERYRTPSELLDDLESLRLKRQPQHSKSETGYLGRTRAMPARSRLRKWLLLLLALALLGLAGAMALRHPEVKRYMNPNTQPAVLSEPSPASILGDDDMKVVSHMNKDINNPFDYGVQVKVFIQNLSDQPQTRDLKVELDWKGKAYYKNRSITLAARSSDTFTLEFYEPTAGEEYYTYKVLVTK